MKRLIILAALALSACDLGTVASVATTAPVTAANKTTLDESIGRGAELAYKAERVLLETGVDTGLLKGASAAKAAQIDNECFAALGLVRTAYRAGNASGYISAAKQVLGLKGQMAALIAGASK